MKLRRLSFISRKPFEEVLSKINSLIGHPEMREFYKSVSSTETAAELEELINKSVGSSGLMEFIHFDTGEILRKEGKDAKIIRLLVGNPLIMKELVIAAPDASAYAPVTILIDERENGVYISHDLMEDLLKPYGSKEANKIALESDRIIETLIKNAAE